MRTFLCLIMLSSVILADGLENFNNFPETSSSYKDGTFLGQDGSTWTYAQCRGDLSISGKSPCLGRARTPMAQVYSGTIAGGCATLSFVFRKEFSTAVKLDVLVNSTLVATVEDASGGASAGTTVFAGPYSVNIPGDVVLKFQQNYGTAGGQVTIDDIAWTGGGGGPGDDPNISMPASLGFGQIEPGTVKTQSLALANNGLSNTLTISAFNPFSGATGNFSIGAVPATLTPGSASNVPIVYIPGNVSNASHSAIFQLLCNDPSNPTNNVTVTGSTYGPPPPVLSVSNIQYTTDPSGDSPYKGQTVEVVGVVSYIEPNSQKQLVGGYGISDAGGGPWSGVYVYDNVHRPEYGDRIQITAVVDEYYNLTELKSVSAFAVLSASNAMPVTYTTALTVNQEAYEGVLAGISNVTVSDINIGNSNRQWRVSDTVGSCMVDVRCPYRYIWQLNQQLTAIVGHVYYSFGNFMLEPRDDDDFIGRPVMQYALKGTVMTPDGPQSNWYVQIWDDDIVAVTNVPPAGVPLVDTAGLIFPGLIDAHNHPSYNSFPTLAFNNFPFGHRDQWGGDQEYTDWKAKRTEVRTAVNDSGTARITKWGEILELMAGCITMQGQSGYDVMHAHPDIILYNVEQYPARIQTDIFPWTMTAAERDTFMRNISNGLVNASMIHLCEGPDATSLAQFNTLEGWGLLNQTITIIHGTPLGTTEFTKMAAVGAKMVWSPMSNMKLFEATANVKLAHQLGVTVGISPDWTPSGSYNMLEELGYAWYLNQTIFSNYFTAQQLVEMVTVNNAKACGFDNRYGSIRVGYNAGLCVIEAVTNEPYLSLICARPRNVKLVTVDGMPRYGDPAVLQQLGVTGETTLVSGTVRMFNIAINHPFVFYDYETVSQIRSTLATAHGALTPVNELEPDELQFLNLELLQAGPDNIPPFRAENPLAAPANGAQFIIGDPASLTFRRQDFWDDETDSRDLVHQIAIVPQADPAMVLQTITNAVRNYGVLQTDKNLIVPFVPTFDSGATQLVFRFITADHYANTRTTAVNAVAFTVVPEPMGFGLLAGALALLLRRRMQARPSRRASARRERGSPDPLKV